MNAAWKWSISFVLTALAVVVSYLWLDRPIALFAHERLKQYNLFDHLTHIPEIVTPLVLLGFAVIGLYALFGRPLTKLHMVAVLCAASVAVTEAIKFQLKFAFGRTWPETWVRNNPSFIRDNVNGFTGELGAKELAMLHELLPRAATVGFLENPNNPIHELTTRDVLAAAPVIGLKVQIFEARTDRELDAAFASLVPGAGDVLGQPQPKVASEARGTAAKPVVTAPL